MEGLGALLFIGFVLFVFFSMFKRNPNTVIPKVANKDALSTFAAEVGSGYGYHYFFDNTGYAINMNEKTVAISTKGVLKIYPVSDIRKIERVMVTPQEIILTGKHSIGDHARIGHQNDKYAREAYDDSGLFIHVADIDTPVINIKFIDEKLLEKSYEIFNQAMEGRLPHKDGYAAFENESLNATKEKTLKEQRKAMGLCVICGESLVRDFDKTLGYHKACVAK